MSVECDLIEAASTDLRREIDKQILAELAPDWPYFTAIRRGPGWGAPRYREEC